MDSGGGARRDSCGFAFLMSLSHPSVLSHIFPVLSPKCQMKLLCGRNRDSDLRSVVSNSTVTPAGVLLGFCEVGSAPSSSTCWWLPHLVETTAHCSDDKKELGGFPRGEDAVL